MTGHPPLDVGELYRVLAESTPDAIITIDEASTILSINPAGERLVGHPAASLVGGPLTRIMPERFVASHRAGVTRYAATGVRRIPWRAVRVPVLAADGREIPVEISFGEFTSGGRRVFSAVLRDVSERLAAESALAANADLLQKQAVELEHQVEEAQVIGEELEQTNQELRDANAELRKARIEAEGAAERLLHKQRELEVERARLSDVFMQAPVAVAVVRGRVARDLVYELVNPRYVEILPPGRDPLGRRVGDVLPEMDDALLGEMQRVLDTGRPFSATDHRIPFDRDGDGVAEDYYFNFVYHPLTDADGRVTGLVGVGTEVTASVRARREAERLREAADAARAEAEAANRAKGEFLATMSHELRTPLNAIGGYAELLELGLRGPVTPEQASDLGRIQRSQRHLLGLINGVLNYARVEGGHVHYELSDVEVDEVLATCEALVAPQVRARKLAFRFPACASEVRARADADKVQQIVLNLLSNALKFTEPGGSITMRCEVDDRRVVVRVTDDGRGIAPDQLERVFQPFVQLDAKLTRTHGGTGLGLAISRDLARGMGGDLTVESAVGEGSTFTLALPRSAGA